MRDTVRIRHQLEQLVGRSLYEVGFAIDLLFLRFGEKLSDSSSSKRRSRENDLALHVQCAWRFVVSEEISVGAADHFWERKGSSDEVLAAIESLLSSQPVVERVTYVSALGFGLLLSDGIEFQAFPCGSSVTDYEFWRLFLSCQETPHFVVGSRGVSGDIAGHEVH